MRRTKSTIVVIFVLFALVSCFGSRQKGFVIAESKSYEASLFRQHCAICHGKEGEGRTLDDGTQVPSLREGMFKMNTPDQVYKQITDGGNGMTPFRGQLTDRERRLLTDLVVRQLRSN